MPIYTKTGDAGISSVIGNAPLPKSAAVFDVVGVLDELNASLGYIHSSRIKEIREVLINIQSDLFEIGAFIANEKTVTSDLDKFLVKVTTIEKLIDNIDSQLTPLKNFILPGGARTATDLHVSRALCRRLERTFVAYLEQSRKKELDSLIKYFNRLSDLLFVLARYANHKVGVKDIIWKRPV